MRNLALFVILLVITTFLFPVACTGKAKLPPVSVGGLGGSVAGAAGAGGLGGVGGGCACNLGGDPGSLE